MKKFVAQAVFVVADLLIIVLAIVMAHYLRSFLPLFDEHKLSLNDYLHFYPLYILPLALFFYSGIYTNRYDFWQETKQVIKALLFSILLVFAYLAMMQTADYYSRFVLVGAFILMMFLIPLEKNILKKYLYTIGLWRKTATIYGSDPFLTYEIFSNPYLGYFPPKEGEEAQTIFVNSVNMDAATLNEKIEEQIRLKHEVVFIPLLNTFDLTHSKIYQLTIARTNLILFQNRLKSGYRLIVQQSFNYLFALLLLPFVLPLIGVIAFLIKKESPGPVFFTHNRIGQNGRIIPVLKFRSMYNNAQQRLQKMLEEEEEIKREWEENFKLKTDPRITKIGAFLRKTSLDELPQIFNVLKGEMNFVGPRPVVQEELDRYYKEDRAYYYMVKPGITGLWQVSGRSDTDYDYRVKTDKWYVMNWSLWLDIVILIKTLKVVFKQKGAY